ncbi:vav 3 guanine nucleotide exchange factor isoform 1-like protein [Camelus ferus]|nr:vav 3 guanine nucleotide exchange factor isoform 1-like protein [Camelus ferus]
MFGIGCLCALTAFVSSNHFSLKALSSFGGLAPVLLSFIFVMPVIPVVYGQYLSISIASPVIETLSRLSRTPIALATGIRPFPTEESVNDDDVYKGLPDLIECSGKAELTECKALLSLVQLFPWGSPDSPGHAGRDAPLRAVDPALGTLDGTPLFMLWTLETRAEDEEGLYDCVYGEDEGGEVYEDLMKAEEAQPPYFMAPLKRFLTAAEFDSVFINIPELVKVHRNLMQEIHDSIVNKNDQNLYQVFINYKERLVIYGQYCSGVESAISSLDYISKTKEDVKLKLEELVKHTMDPMEKANLKLALDAMKDLAQYVNEVKRDNETLREIKQFQLSIENLHSVCGSGGPLSHEEILHTVDAHIFLFDLAVIVCKRKGDNYEMKEIIDLQQYKIANNPTTDKENKKWSYGFYLIHIQGQNGLEFYCKTKDLKKKWLEQFEMALSNIRPDHADSNFHEFKMHTFNRVTSCKVCQMLLRGTFYQGYLCFKCGARAHKECLGRVDNCARVNSAAFIQGEVQALNIDHQAFDKGPLG